MTCYQVLTGRGLGRLAVCGRRFALLLLLVGCAIAAANTRAEIQIFYQADDLADPIAGEDLWRYNYAVSGDQFSGGHGFTIYFEENLTGSLQLISFPAAEWDAETSDPDHFFDLPGELVAQAKQDLPPSLWPFTVDFVWTGNGAPGSQRYVLFDADFVVLGPPGATLAIPEPQSSLLLLAGLALLAAVLVRRPVKRGASCSR